MLAFFEYVTQRPSLADKRYAQARATYEEWTEPDRGNLAQAFLSAPRPAGVEVQYISLLAFFHDAGEPGATLAMQAVRVEIRKNGKVSDLSLLQWLRDSEEPTLQTVWDAVGFKCTFSSVPGSDYILVKFGG